MTKLLERLGLGRPDLRAWAMYDWANSAFQTTIIAAIFPIYFASVVAADLAEADRTSRFAWATTIAIVIVALVAPLLGAIADYAAVKKKMLAAFLGMGAAATLAMYGLTRGDWMLALVLFVIGNVGVAGSIVFYESLLPHLVGQDELDRFLFGCRGGSRGLGLSGGRSRGLGGVGCRFGGGRGLVRPTITARGQHDGQCQREGEDPGSLTHVFLLLVTREPGRRSAPVFHIVGRQTIIRDGVGSCNWVG